MHWLVLADLANVAKAASLRKKGQHGDNDLANVKSGRRNIECKIFLSSDVWPH
jgi:hypothetical protein